MFRFAVSLAFAGILVSTSSAQTPLDNSFKFQGELRSNNVVATSNHDFIFDLFNVAAGGATLGTNNRPNVAVARGVFTTTLDFGSGIFTGDKRWLQIRVRDTAVGGAYTTLAPRVELTATPNALFALNIADGSVTTAKIAAQAVTANELAANAVTSSKIAAGAVNNAKLGADSVTTDKIQNGTITGSDIAPNSITLDKIPANVVSAVDGVSNDGGNIDLVAGANITITPNDAANTITIAAAASTNANTLDGVDSTQFLRSDTTDTFTSGTLSTAVGTTLAVNGGFTVADATALTVLGSPADLTIAGTNLNLNLGDSAADITNAVGPFNALAGLTANQAAVTQVLRAGTVFDGTVFNSIGTGTPQAGTAIANNGDLFVTFDLEVGANAFLSGDLRMEPASEIDQTIYFFESGSQTSNFIRWDQVFSDDCTTPPQDAFIWNTLDSANSNLWVFANGSDPEAFITDGGVLRLDGSVVTGGACDVAEAFLGPEGLEAGTVVVADRSMPEAVEVSMKPYDAGIIGVVSTEPGLLLAGPTADAYPMKRQLAEVKAKWAFDPENLELAKLAADLEFAVDHWRRGNVSVALAGRVPVKVVGPVLAGQPLTSSIVPGHAMAMTEAGPSIGLALSSHAGPAEGTVLVLVQPGYRLPVFPEDLDATAGDDVVKGEKRENAGSTSVAQTFEDRLARLETALVAVDGRDGHDGADGLDGTSVKGEDGQDALDRDTAPVVRLQKESWGDFDADGLDDVLVLNPGAPAQLLKNLGNGRFQDVTAHANLGDTTGARIGLWQDYDLDQRLDLLLIGQSGAGALFEGAGTGSFTNMTATLGVDFGQPIVAAEWLDYDADHLPDLRVEIADGTVALFHNLGHGSFEKVTLRNGLATGEVDQANLRIAELETQNSDLAARLQALEALVGQLTAAERK